ncbi:hypothetical protein BH09PLA1_BH09PLA1_30600 [soil metagenome]
MHDVGSIDTNIIRVEAPPPEALADAYLVDVRCDNRGVRRAQVSAIVGPLLPDPWPSTAITAYTAPPHWLARPAAQPARVVPLAFRKFVSLVAAVCVLVISLGAYAAIRIQQLSHELSIQRRSTLIAATPEKWQTEIDSAKQAVATMAASLKLAETRSDSSAAEIQLREDALVAASSSADHPKLTAQLKSYIRQLNESSQPVDTFNAMGGLLASRDLPANAQLCFTAALDAPTCTKPQRVLALAGLADACARQGKLDDADSLYRELIDIERGDRDLSQRAVLHLAELVKVKIRRGLEEDADEAVSALFSRLGNRAKALDPSFVRQLVMSLADFAIDSGNVTIAIRLLERATLLQDSSTSAAVAAPFHQMLLTLHAQTGGDLEARRLLRKVLQQQTTALGNDPEVAKTAMQLAAIDERLGDLNSAEKMLKLSLDIRERSFGSNHLEVADTAYALARVYERQGRRSEAEALLGLVKGIWNRKQEAERADGTTR